MTGISDFKFQILYRCFIIVLFLLLFDNIHAQSISNKRSKWFTVTADTLHIDSLSLIPGSVITENNKGEVISPEKYFLNESTSLLVWKKKPVIDSVKISYRVFPLQFTNVTQHKSFEYYNKRDSLYHSIFIYSPTRSNENIFDLGGMNYNGSFARGISFGNNQDVVVNSNFNLQLAGRLAGDVDVLAAISDNNIPIQPEGNTQQLQEFDKVFIQLKKDKSQLTVGDFELSKPADSYFMNFYKKLQGGNASTFYKITDSVTGFSKVSISVAKGKYAKNNFNGLEGNQGPYRLTGNSGETFIIILAGTEKVFLDGQLMQRGDDRDYVIDYNAGTVTFTPRRLITKDKRISIEFEYSDKSYLRTVFFGKQALTYKKWQFDFNAYSEQDNKNQPLQQSLDSTQRRVLFNAGDSLQHAYFTSIDSIAFNPDRVLYKRIDSTGFGTIYVYSTNKDSAHFSLNFSQVGNNKGNYVLSTSSANGRVYKWIAPVNGIPQGNYEPVIPLSAPKKQQLFTAGTTFRYSNNGKINVEGALSNNDINTFSPDGDNNNKGTAIHGTLSQDFILSNIKDKVAKLSFNTNYEYTGKYFKPIERYRPVEFERDWNLQNVDSTAEEQTGFFLTTLSKQNIGNITYRLGMFQHGNTYSGVQNSVTGNLSTHGFIVVLDASLLQSKGILQRTEFLRPSIDFSKGFERLKHWRVGIKLQEEKNRFFTSAPHSLFANSFLWNQYTFYIKSNDTSKLRFGADYSKRSDYAVTGNTFQQATEAQTLSAHGEWSPKPAIQIRWHTAYRELFIKDTTLTSQKQDQSLLGRAEYNFIIKKGFITTQTLYEIGSGQQQKIQFTYVQVPAGQGIYTYAGDYNNNGVKDLNEFEIAPFTDLADYIKVYNTTNEYVKTYTTQLAQSLGINPKVLWSGSTGGMKKFITRFNSQTTIQIDRKTLKSNFNNQFNPLQLAVDDTVLASLNASMSQYLYFNRNSPVYRVDIGWQNNLNKSALVNGAESRKLSIYSVRLRWNLSKKLTTVQKLEQKQKENISEFFQNLNYRIGEITWEPQLVLQPNNKLRFALTYDFIQSKNYLGDIEERSLQNKGTLEAKYNVLSKSTLNTRFTYADIHFTGTGNSPVQFAMLEGLLPGTNLLWSVSLEKKMSNKINLSLSYDGRKTGTAKMVHVGRAQLQALF